MAASEWGRSEVVRILLEEGAEAGLKSSSGWSALVIASGEGHLEVAKELMSCGQIQELPTALVAASENGHCEIIELLLNSLSNSQQHLILHAYCNLPTVICLL